MPQDVKKRIERFHLNRLLPALGVETAEVTQDERPDFIVDYGTRRVAVEVTQLFRDSGPHGSATYRDEKRRMDLMSGLASSHYSSGGAPTHVKVLLPLGHTPDRSAFTQLHPSASDIRTILAELKSVSWSGTLVTYERAIELECRRIAKLWIQPLPPSSGEYDRWPCIGDSAGWRSTLNSELVQSCIDNKSGLISECRARCSEVVLLLVINKTLASGIVRIDPTFEAHSRGFDAIYVDPFPEQVFRLFPLDH